MPDAGSLLSVRVLLANKRLRTSCECIAGKCHRCPLPAKAKHVQGQFPFTSHPSCYRQFECRRSDRHPVTPSAAHVTTCCCNRNRRSSAVCLGCSGGALARHRQQRSWRRSWRWWSGHVSAPATAPVHTNKLLRTEAVATAAARTHHSKAATLSACCAHLTAHRTMQHSRAPLRKRRRPASPGCSDGSCGGRRPHNNGSQRLGSPAMWHRTQKISGAVEPPSTSLHWCVGQHGPRFACFANHSGFLLFVAVQRSGTATPA